MCIYSTEIQSSWHNRCQPNRATHSENSPRVAPFERYQQTRWLPALCDRTLSFRA